MKKILTTLLLSFVLLPCFAQSAGQILNQVVTKLQKAGIKASFEATTFKGVSPNGTVLVTIQAEGNKFKIQSSNMTTWFNGKTLWSMMLGSDEVNVSTPTEADIQKMNPTAFINLYRDNCTYYMEPDTYDGKTCRKITVVPKARTSFLRLVILVDAKGNLMNVRLKDAKGNWMRFRISQLQTGIKFSKSTFEFSKKDYPKVEVIDLR